MKRKISFILILLFIIIGILVLCTGGKIGSVMLSDYSISEDGNVMTLKVGVPSSIGFIRKLKEKDDGIRKYITFYSTYGLNSRIGANDEFQIDLNTFCNEIFFFSGDNRYKLILKRNSETKEWERVKGF